MTRRLTGRRRFVAHVVKQAAQFGGRLRRHVGQRGARVAAGQAAQAQGGLQAGHAVA